MACYNANVAKFIRQCQFGLVVLAAVLLPTSAVSAESNLAAIICDPSQSAELTVVQPHSDSVVNNANIELSGEVKQASQLELYVDDAYSGVVPLSYTDTTYSTTVAISLGTHTIKVVAVDVCQVGNATVSVVVTYQDAALASTGNQVPTNVAGTAVAGQSAVSRGSLLERFVMQPLLGVAESLDLIAYDSVNGQMNNANVIRFVIIVAALLVMFYATSISRRLTWLAKRVRLHPKTSASALRRLRRIILGVGLAVIVVVFMV